ncbi:MAG: hypothetical protein HYX28_10230 [Candidatus Koribacter versatilis]|uniref:DUF3806 domain-containing protein n=1 Tax=Candidatus Korobacter versatilis TaxID=658062 RepID=A0A932A9P0_9BACT|nr:hypothetical protein [Candidatus Koribacter versatilis]
MAEASSVEQMVGDYAKRAVEQARAAKVELDFSEASVARLEGLLEDAPQEDVAEAAKMWGAYFGEVVRRRWGGEWSIETYPGQQFATLTLTVNGSKLFPSMKIYRRLTQGASEDLRTFYQSVKERLGRAPASRVN